MFALIWGGYVVTDALAEIGGALFGKQKLRVWRAVSQTQRPLPVLPPL